MTEGGAVRAGGSRVRGIHRTALLVLLVGLLATGGLSFAAYTVHQRNEDRLLDQRAREAAASLVTILPSLESGLASAAELVRATGADPALFERLFGSLTGSSGPFVSASVWDAAESDPQPLVVLGRRPALAGESAATIREFLRRASGHRGLSVESLLDATPATVGYGVASTNGDPRFVVYAETVLPDQRTDQPKSGSAFENLDYAAYLAPREDAHDLLGTSADAVPLTGRRAEVTVPYGDLRLHLVVSPQRDQGGELLRLLPWIIAVVGTLITLAFTAVTERLLRRSDVAHRLADENAALYDGQRTVAETLQRSLLPERLPAVPALELAGRFEPGVDGIEIGGDWYDVWETGPDRVLAVVGDVSGRGLRAATVMASLRYATRAFATEGESPGEILSRLGRLLRIDRDGHFATVVCAAVDLGAGTLTVASAGHPPPLVVDDTGARFLEVPAGLPVGIDDAPGYEEATLPVPVGATVLLFTDGLFERRGEVVDDGLERLRQAAHRPGLSLEALLTAVYDDLAQPGAQDDTAILGLRFRPPAGTAP